MANITLIRHWECVNNVSEFIRDDDSDGCLTEKWVQQIKDLQNLFALDVNDILYSSPLWRAVQSCEILFPEKEPIIVEEFRELNKWFSQGPFRDMTWTDWNILFTKNFADFSQWSWRYPNWESIEDLYRRVVPKFEEITKKSLKNWSNSYIVAHNWVIKVILQYVLKTNTIWYKNLRIKNGWIVKIEYTDEDWYSLII